ncbi:MAG TPA: hypothetical protein DCZ92_03905 [Elusimicrobia bacterium]|nr:MAG: hypothetical protein A2016_01200 [Elusimicrobia bacterium GWF2_62_30]HBA59961.1 hypothetical protein [Elusimicrobiota bacterium]
MRRTRSLLLSAVCLFYTGTSSAASLTVQVAKTAKKFSDSAAALGLSSATVAIFQFEADKELSRKKANFAVTELLTHHILAQKTLQVTERTQLSAVLREQRLGLSGALDAKTASGVGQILGARLLVLGNVVKLGKSYQIVAKLVDSKTAEIIASEVVEVPAETFNKDAAPYLVLVPKSQAIGAFVTGNYGFVTTRNSPTVTYNSASVVPSNPDAHSISTGWGLRYWPADDYMIEASYSRFKLSGGRVYTILNATSVDSKQPPLVALSGYAIQLTVNRIFAISQVFRFHIGAGALNVLATMPTTTGRTNGYWNVSVQYTSEPLSYLAPILRTGLEWKPQERIGFGIFGSYSLLRRTVVQKVILDDGTNPTQTSSVWEAELSPFALETTLSLYF